MNEKEKKKKIARLSGEIMNKNNKFIFVRATCCLLIADAENRRDRRKTCGGENLYKCEKISSSRVIFEFLSKKFNRFCGIFSISVIDIVSWLCNCVRL